MTSKNDIKDLRRPPYAFTEQGVAMLSSILHSNTAINTSINNAGEKILSINLIEDKFIKASLFKVINKTIKKEAI